MWCQVRNVVVALAAGAVPLHAQDSIPAPARPGEQLTVYLATFGQGDQVWERFGHNAIWVRDAAAGTMTSYNYGMFAFDEPGFVSRFVRGRMLYWMAARDAEHELFGYQQSNRSAWLQRLNLTAEQKHQLRDFLDLNTLPENSHYLYHYYYDNCSTRVRDALDRALGGAIRAQLTAKQTGTTYRWHSLRLTGESLLVYTGLSLGLAMPTDRPIDAWEEGFIPMQLMARLRDVRVTGPTGEQLPLVAEEHTLFEAQRPPEATAPPKRWPAFLLAGLLLGAGIVLIARRARTRARARLYLAVALSTWGGIAGFFGLLLAFLWLATDHTTSHGNQNLLQVNPLSLLFAVAAPLAVRRRTSARAQRLARLAWRLSLVLFGLSLTGALLHLFPSVAQGNGPIIGLVFPLHVASVLSLRQVDDPRTSTREDVSQQMSAVRAA